jgi:hypothetical protein
METVEDPLEHLQGSRVSSNFQAMRGGLREPELPRKTDVAEVPSFPSEERGKLPLKAILHPQQGA